MDLRRRVISSLIGGEDMKVLGAGNIYMQVKQQSGGIDLNECALINSPSIGKSMLTIFKCNSSTRYSEVYILNTGEVELNIGNDHPFKPAIIKVFQSNGNYYLGFISSSTGSITTVVNSYLSIEIDT